MSDTMSVAGKGRRVPAFGRPPPPPTPAARLVLLVTLLLLVKCTSAANVTPERRMSSRVVTTKYGALRGYLITLPNRSLQAVESFMGIPYASPPVGKLRFMPPVTPAHWTGVRSAGSAGPVCPQTLPDVSNETHALSTMTSGRLNQVKRLLPLLQTQSEDCLYLNIYVPASAGRESVRLPVLIYIHGESYEWNAGSSYDGSVLSSSGNIIVVTINFRLGVLGFFPVLEGNTRGNFALMDQVAALHWIQENIHEFAGDPSNVSIMGHGFGAACVNLLMLSPMAKGLFHRAIVADGSALSPWTLAHDPVTYSHNLAAGVACPDEPDQNALLVDCLRKKSAQELVRLTVAPTPKYLTSVGPTVDGIVLPNDPASLMDSSLFGSYDLMLGLCKVPYYEFSAADERLGIQIERRDPILRTLVRNLYTHHLQEIHLTIANEYTDWSHTPSSHKSTDVLESLIEVLGDATVAAPLIRTALRHSRFNKRTFLFEFAHGTERGDHPPTRGCIHGDDLAFLFGAPLVPGMQLSAFHSNFNKHETALSELLISYISNFVRTGNPNIDARNNSTKESSASHRLSDRMTWPQFEEKQQQFLSLSVKPKIGHHYRGHRLSFWNNLIPQLDVASTSSGDQHLLDDHHSDGNSFEGVTRDPFLPRLRTLMDSTSSSASTNSTSSSRSASDKMSSLRKITASLTTTVRPVISGQDQRPGVKSASPSSPSLSDSRSNHSNRPDPSSKSMNASVSAMFQEGSYSATLSITLAVGATLLVLNVLVFAGMVFRRERGNAVAQQEQPQHNCHRLAKGMDDRHKSHGASDQSMNQFKSNRSHLYPGDPSLDVVVERLTPSPVQSSSPAGFTDFSAHVSMLHSDSFFSGTGIVPTSINSSLDPKLLTVHRMAPCDYGHSHSHNSQDVM